MVKVNTTKQKPILGRKTRIAPTQKVSVHWASQVALMVKNKPTNAGDIRNAGLIPGLRRSPGEGHSNPLQYSCLENPMDRGAGGLQSMGSQRVRHN